MKMRVVPRPFLLLLAVACNNPDSALFSQEAPGSSQAGSASVGEVGGGSSGVGGAPGAAATAGSATTGGVAGGVSGTSADGGSTVLEAGGAGGAAPEPDDMPMPPMCGNGKLEAGEQCDDAGHEGEDGCSAECQVVCSDFGSDVEASADHHCYAGYDEADFEGAQAACLERGAHLVTITSAAENEIVSGFVNSSKFIGAFEAVDLTNEGSGSYQWITDEAFEYENWDAEQPDRAGERCNQNSNNPRCYQHCASMQGDGTWADQRCDLADGYVCEWEPAGL